MTGRAGPPSTTPLRSRSVQALREHLERQGAELTRLRVAAVDGSSHAREDARGRTGRDGRFERSGTSGGLGMTL